MRRRDFVKVIIGSAAAWPLAARAQQPAGRLPTIGFLGGDASVWRSWTAIFVARLRELGWIEDRTVAIEYRWSEGRPERIAEVAAEFVRLKVDVILTNNLSTPTMKEATSVIPIVFVLGNDPVGDGFVASLARPGGNVTGVSTQQTETASKALEILRQIVPRIGRVAILANTGNLSAARQAHGLQAAASALGLETVALEIRRAEDIAPAFAALDVHTDALDIVQDALITTNVARIMTFALTARLPTIFHSREFLSFGGLMSYGPSYPPQFSRAADLVDKILRGAKPGDIPVEQPTKFDFVINQITAKALGITVPQNLLIAADEVIE